MHKCRYVNTMILAQPVCPGYVSSGVEDPASHLSACAMPAPPSGLWLLAWCRNCVLRHSCFLHVAGSFVASRVSKYLQNSRLPSAGREPRVETHPMDQTKSYPSTGYRSTNVPGGKDQRVWQMGRGGGAVPEVHEAPEPNPQPHLSQM